MSDNIQTQIQELIAEIVEVSPDDIKPGVNFVKDLGADSMTALEIMAALEKKFGVALRPEHLPELLTLDHITALITRLTCAK
jgi:acyl carrier protein